MNRRDISEKVAEIARKVVIHHDVELVRAEAVGSLRNPTIRVFIDKPAGITHEDCAAVSRDLSEELDRFDFINSSYLLEVSSPGLERELYNLADYVKFVGRLARVRTKIPIANQRNFRGRIKAVEGEQIIFCDKSNGEVKFTWDQVGKANLEVDVEEEFRRARGN